MNSKIKEKNQKIINKKPTENNQLTNSHHKNNKAKIIFENKRKTEHIGNYTKTTSKFNFVNDSILNYNIKNKQKIKQIKRENISLKNKEKEIFNNNIYINKIINKKNNSSINRSKKNSSSISESFKNKKQNSNIDSNYNNEANLFQEKDKNIKAKKKRLDSYVTNSNKSKISKMNSNNTTIQIHINKNRIRRLSPKALKNNTISNRLNIGNDYFNINNKSTKINIKTKKLKNDLKENRFNNNSDKINKANSKNNYLKDINNNKFRNYKTSKNLADNKNLISNTKTFATNNKTEKFPSNTNKDVNLNQIDMNKDLIMDEHNMYIVKKSLFSRRMNFLNNYHEGKIDNKGIENNENNFNYNYMNIPLNSILHSTENKEFESKFINYDLGKTTGTSQFKDSLIAFGNDISKHDNDISKLINFQKNILEDENERTKDELEKLAELYFNISKNLENKKNRNNIDKSQTNTITTIIYNEESFC